MILFEYIRLIILIMPLGIFLTFGILVVVTLSLKQAKLEEVFKRILFFYCLSAAIASFLLFTYYYRPLIFAYFDILYCASSIFAIILFHHMLCFMIRFDKPFDKRHYILAVSICGILLVCKLIFPALWTEDGTRVLMVVILLFGIVHSLFSLLRLHNHQMQLMQQGCSSEVIDKSRAIPFIVEILLFPWVFAACPLIGGQNPGVLSSLILMGSIMLALRMNIPLTYSMLRHYSTPFNETSLLASIASEFQPQKVSGQHTPEHIIDTSTTVKQKNRCDVENVEIRQEIEEGAQTSKRGYKKYDEKHIQKGVLIEIDQKEFELYFCKEKPYLNPNLTIYDVVEALKSNRTYLSKFINKVYKKNFNAYVNSHRLLEMEHLLSLPKNKDKTTNQLFKQAGFSAHRTYLRAKRMQEEENLKRKTTKKQKK